jgi:hypothetical protein
VGNTGRGPSPGHGKPDLGQSTEGGSPVRLGGDDGLDGGDEDGDGSGSWLRRLRMGRR